MRISWLIGAGISFVIGFLLTSTIIGALIGLPLIIVSIFILVLGFILPDK